jgi:predicted esterase
LVDGTIYISANADNEKPLPLILYVYGSGQPASNFAIKNGVVQYGGSSLHRHFEELAGDRARIMVVDNATVKFGDQSWNYKRGTLDAQRQFLELHTLPNWIELLKSAIEAAWQEPWIDASKTLICGHSDGAGVVARLAEAMPGISHVAPLAAGGLCHLLFFKLGTPAPFGIALDEALKEVQNIQSNPNSIENFYAGFTYKFWSSGYLFMSDFESLARTSARIYAAHGTADQNNSIQGFDFMCSGLKMLGKDIIIERIEGGDHAFHIAGAKEREGFRPVLSKVVDWFL